MAGAGYKLFNTGDVLTAAQVNTYLQEQTVMVFASSAARTSALSGVLAEGMVSYLQDTNAVEVYNGSAWVGVSGAGDVTEVQAGTGISVASGTGPIPVVTNTMATAIDAAGDLIYGTGADTFARLGIGTAGQVLKVNSGATAPEWGAAAGGSWTTWTPTATNYTKGNGTETARYLDVNGTIFFFYKFVLGSTSSITGEPSTSLPASVKSGQGDAQIYGIIRDAGTTTFEGSWNIDQPNSKIVWYAANSSSTYTNFSNVNTTVPMTWTTNDFIAILGWYEKA